MRPIAKVGLAVGLYIVAFVVAWVVVDLYVAATKGADRHNYGVMFAFGDSLLFVAVFAVAAVPAAGATLFFLRSRPAFWLALSVGSLLVAGTSLVAVLTYLAPRVFDPRSFISEAAPLRILVAPLFAVFFLLSGVIAPDRSSRISLILATFIEVSVFACVALMWLHVGSGL